MGNATVALVHTYTYIHRILALLRKALRSLVGAQSEWIENVNAGFRLAVAGFQVECRDRGKRGSGRER